MIDETEALRARVNDLTRALDQAVAVACLKPASINPDGVYSERAQFGSANVPELAAYLKEPKARAEIARRRAVLVSRPEPVPFPLWKGVLSGLGLTGIIAFVVVVALFLLGVWRQS